MVLFNDSTSNYETLYYAHNFNTMTQNNNTTYRAQKTSLNIFHSVFTAQHFPHSRQSTAIVSGLVLFAVSLLIKKIAE